MLSSCEPTGGEERETSYFHEILGMEESCMGCHNDYTGFAQNHNPQAIGCSPCHRGNPSAVQKDQAHEDMILVPGNLSDVKFTCGAANCHGDIASRVEKSLMTTMAGVVNVNRFVFGESDTLTAYAHVADLKLDRAADVHLRQLCASCHLGNEKDKAAPVKERSRGGGCIACHLDYSGLNYVPLDANIPGTKIHPAINLKVTNAHCFGCHSRSGRISTNFEGWHETTLDAKTYADEPGYRLLEDGRIFEKIAPDVHHQLGLECIDCHSAKELMGDGQVYLHEEDAVSIQCSDCHFSTLKSTISYEDLDVESKKILQLRNADYKDAQFVRTHKGDDPIINVIMDGEKPVMVSKNSGRRFDLSPPAEICERGNAHSALSCNACHTAWAPQCVGCHTAYDPKELAFDHLTETRQEGKWVEYLGEFFAEPPGLGIVEEEDVREVKTFIQGMIMTIDKSEFPREAQTPEIFHRLFAPTVPHTISKQGRSCQSCHNNPVALGYGHGDLEYQIKEGSGHWVFISEYENMPQDHLPQDAWIGFLEVPKKVAATRPNARPFTIPEQQKILTVGACLTCHGGDTDIMQDALLDFSSAKKEADKACVFPVWD